MRLPPAPLVRLVDWRPTDVQDLAPSDGKWKILVFVRDLRASLALAEFCGVLAGKGGLGGIVTTGEEKETGEVQKGKGKGKEDEKRVVLYTIGRNPRSEVQWVDVPELGRDWKRVYVSDAQDREHNAFELFGIPVGGGGVVVVRPDGYILIVDSLEQGMAREAAEGIVRFFAAL